MKKKEFVAKVSEKLGVSAAQASRIVDAVVDVVTDALARHDSVSLQGFGTFEVRERAARIGRNPRTGEAVEIAASKYPAFKPGKLLKDAVHP